MKNLIGEQGKAIKILLGCLAAVPTLLTIPWLLTFIGIKSPYLYQQVWWAKTFNPPGYTYYEPPADYSNATKYNAYRLIMTGSKQYDDSFQAINQGDILKAIIDTNIRAEPNKNSPVKNILARGDCVIVISNDKQPVKGNNPNDKPGGYISIATIPCPNSNVR
jgi:hypothetical protein